LSALSYPVYFLFINKPVLFMAKNRLLIPLLLCNLLCGTLMAQYNQPQNRVWAMGNKVGLDFSTATPSVITTNLASGNEGCASVCDNNGALRFYTNGTNVWNANGAIMPNGTNINGVSNNTISTTQGAVIIPDPANANRYYLFSLTAVSNCKLFCNVIDMTLNNGAGDIDVTFPLRNVQLATGLTEKMTSVAGCNNNVWVLVHSESQALFKAFEVNASGVSTAPVESLSGNFPANYYTQGVLKASQNKSKLMTCNFVSFGAARGLEIYDFDYTSGTVSNAVILDSAVYYGGTFSPEGSKVYAQTTTSPGIVYQFDLAAANPAQSKVNLGLSGQYADMKIGPDGKIYFGAMAGSPGYNNYRYMGRINNPENAGAACNFQDSVTALLFLNAAGTAGALAQGLPNEVVIASAETNHSVAVALDTVVCSFPVAGGWDLRTASGKEGYLWDNGTTDSTRNITARGIYWVTYSTACGTHTDSFKIKGDDLPALSIVSANNILSTTHTFDTYQWYKGSNLISGAVNATLAVTENGWYSVVVRNEWGCSDSAAFEVTGITDIADINFLRSNISIYPNPATDVLFVNAPAAVTLSLYNVDGRILIQNKNAKRMDLSGLTSGLYFLRIEDAKGNLIKMEKIIKSK
jgi:hypothetical protein